ncbi:MAG: GerMN domain-containing protein [Firmicutes bacterium]|nr:GerMN domain-containing protein [Bacillota bacterium]
MKSVVKFFLYLGVIGLILYTGGCFNQQTEKTADTTEKTITLTKSAAPPTEKVITLTRSAAPPAAGDTLPTLANLVDKTTVVMYFANQDGQLTAEQREIPNVVGIARETIQALISGPQDKSLSPTIPAGTKLLDINISDGLCTVDFSQELISKHSGGSNAEYLTVYSIVDTLTQFSTVKEVQIRVAGKIVDSIAGHVGVSTPLQRDDEIISAA